MPYAREFENGQSIRTVGSMVIVETHAVTHDGSPEPVNGCSFDARHFRSAEFLNHELTVYVDGLVGEQPGCYDGGHGWSFGLAKLMEAISVAQQEGQACRLSPSTSTA